MRTPPQCWRGRTALLTCLAISSGACSFHQSQKHWYLVKTRCQPCSILSWQSKQTTLGSAHAGYEAVHGSLRPAGQHGSLRNVVDLHVPSHYSIPEDPPQPELHSRALQEGLALPSPKVPTFSVFSALHDSVLGEVRAAATQHGISP